MRVLFTVSDNSIVLNIIPTLYEGYILSVHRMLTENRPVDPGSIHWSHRPISFMRNKYRTRERPIMKLVELSINNHFVGVILNHHIANGT